MYTKPKHQDNREFHRGDIFYADLNPYVGSEQGGVRPVVVLQNDMGNIFSQTIIVAPATTRTYKKPSQPTHVVLEDVEGLAEVSLFMLEQVRTIDKRRVRYYVGKMTEGQMERINAALRVSLGLDDADMLPETVEAP